MKKKQTSQPVFQQTTLRDIIERHFDTKEGEYELKQTFDDSYVRITYQDLFKEEGMAERLKELTDTEKEQVFVLCFLARNLLSYSIEPYYSIWEKAYKKVLKINYHYWWGRFGAGNGLFLFGYNEKWKIETNSSFEEYLQYLYFLKIRPYINMGSTDFSIWLNKLSYRYWYGANEIQLNRMEKIIKTLLQGDARYNKRFIWHFYFILLLNGRDMPELKELKIKKSLFKKRLEELSILAKLYKESKLGINNRYNYQDCIYWQQKDNEIRREQTKKELQNIARPALLEKLKLNPTTPNWKLSVIIATSDEFKNCGQRDLLPDLTDKDAILSLHLFANGEWIVDLQWFLSSEEDHHLQHASHDRPRVMWRSMYSQPITYQEGLKDKCPDFSNVENFPALINKIEQQFELNFTGKVRIKPKNLDVTDKLAVEKWLSAYACHEIDFPS